MTMTHTSSNPQIPPHVDALLSHLTSRPGVQSTLILARKDGSIIQTTGLLATPELAPSTGASTPRDQQPNTPLPPSGEERGDLEREREPDPVAIPLPESSAASPAPMTPTLPQTKTQTQKKTYQPSRTEALASQIFGFVTSATELSSALSSSSSSSSGREKEKENGVSGGLATDEGINGMNGNGNGKQEEKDADAEDREEEGADDVKLLRFRSKRNEVVVVPDKKYILCVVHDAASSSGGGASRGFR